jgi:hypothetical protein
MIRGALIPTWTWTKDLDSQLSHHVLMILSGSPVLFIGTLGKDAESNHNKSDKREDHA